MRESRGTIVTTVLRPPAEVPQTKAEILAEAKELLATGLYRITYLAENRYRISRKTLWLWLKQDREAAESTEGAA